jgi:outer membrane protein assembly factor BamB
MIRRTMPPVLAPAVKVRVAVALWGATLCGAALALATVSADDNWPRFRGANGGVAADHPSLPEVWGPSQNVVWKVDVPGRSWSSPVVWGDHVFVTTAINTLETETLLPVASYVSRSNGGTMTFMDIAKPSAPHRWVVYDFDLKSGRIRWERVVRTGLPPKSRHLKNSYASETPVTDGERVYAYFGDIGLFAFDMNGMPVWSRPIDAFEMQTGFGHAQSPVVDDRRVYIVNDNEEHSFIAAFDKRTGNQVWRVDRKETSNWTTPLVWKHEQRTEIVTAATGGVRSYAEDGTLLWQLTGMSTFAVPSPLVANGLLYVMSGYSASALRPAYAIRPGAKGDISLKADERTNEYVVWSDPTLGTFHPSPLVYRGCYYILHDRGFLTCNDPMTGKSIYPRQRLSTDTATFTASPWAYNGKVFALSEDGDTFVIQAGPEFKVLGKNSLNEMALATPAVAGDSLIIRTASKLYRISTSTARP